MAEKSHGETNSGKLWIAGIMMASVCLRQSWFLTYKILLHRVYSRPIWDWSTKVFIMAQHLKLNNQVHTFAFDTDMKFMLSNCRLSCLCDSKAWQLVMLFASPCLYLLLMEYVGHGKQIMKGSWFWIQFWALVKYKQLEMWWWNTMWHLLTLLLTWRPLRWTW